MSSTRRAGDPSRGSDQSLSGPASPNFGFLASYDPVLARIAALAEVYALSDPSTSVFKTRQLAEGLLQQVAARLGLDAGAEVSQFELIRTLELRGLLTRDVADLLHHVRRAGNDAVHALRGTTGEAVTLLRMARTLAVWFHRTFGAPAFSPGPFVPPMPPEDPTAPLRAEVDRLRQEVADARARADAERAEAAESAEERLVGHIEALEREAHERVHAAAADRDAALALAEEMEAALAAERARYDADLEAVRQNAISKPVNERTRDQTEVTQRAQAAAAALDLTEADTRRLIDAQLRASGWEADTERLTFARGARPVAGRHLAIAEWPTPSGPADYVLFAGLSPVGVVEAKKKAKHVPSALQQAARYSKGYEVRAEEAMLGPWRAEDDTFRVPFLFATNGRAYLRQIVEQSGIWFRDARRSTNHPRALDGWYSPDGLLALLKQDASSADEVLRELPTDPLPLRDYQQDAVRAVEDAVAQGRREILVAMATGTGKTRMLVGLIYRLVSTKRFRRVLFLVDRKELGTQALEAFETVRLDGLRAFADVYDVKKLAELVPDDDTKVQLATVQGMVRRLQAAEAGDRSLEEGLGVDAYDCVVVDEAHRGYTLDRELGDSELGIRNEADYVSAYRRVIDHFDAVKIGVTATPALHTTEIFGAPVYQYTYRQAVIDGWLIDHEPPVRIETELSRSGIRWAAGEEVQVYHVGQDQTELFRTPDDLGFDVDQFNRVVVTEAFNRVVCTALADHVDPFEPGKTLVFAATDAHADLVVRLLTEAFEAKHGAIEHGTVVKITAAADDPSGLIRRYKNERRPVVAVTVDLLTTGIDVKPIVNLVFLRRVRSRILYEQMLGRATRTCPEIGKEVFRIFDAVDLYAALGPHTAMKPVVKSTAVSIAALLADLERAVAHHAPDAQQLLHEQLVAALRRRRTRLERTADEIETLGGSRPGPLVDRLRRMSPAEAATWLGARPALVRLLDLQGLGDRTLLISDHPDALVEVSRGYGSDDAGVRQRPDEYLDAFGHWLETHQNEIPALLVVTQRPRDLTRADLKALAIALADEGFTEVQLRAAYRDANNKDVAATIIGYIRQRALGSPLVPYEDRVRHAMRRVLESRQWPDAQRRWLERIGQQLTHEVIVDREAIDREQFRAVGGGFERLNRVFDGRLADILGDLQDAIWQESA